MRSVVPLHPSADVVPLGRLELHDLDVLRLLLRGSSIVDWYRLHFPSREAIDAFIRVNELHPEVSEDRARLEEIRERAISYLTKHLKYRIPEPIRSDELRDLFEYASGSGRRAYRLYACITLKVMHIIHYVEAHELLSRLPISDAEVGILLHAKVERVVRGLVERSFPVVEFSGSPKSNDSVISKLLAKKDTQSTQVFDRVRFRFVVERPEDIPALLIALSRELFPFNYLVPSQSENTLVDIDHMLVRAGNLAAIRAAQSSKGELNETPAKGATTGRKNEFSGPDFRVVNFVAEIPVRIDRVLPFQSPRLLGLGPVVFGTVEFQVLDRVTARTNEQGENKHSLYKQRQRGKVRERLERGKRLKGQGDQVEQPEDAAPLHQRRVDG